MTDTIPGTVLYLYTISVEEDRLVATCERNTKHSFILKEHENIFYFFFIRNGRGFCAATVCWTFVDLTRL